MGLNDRVHGKIYNSEEMETSGSIGYGGYGKTDPDSDSYFIRFAADGLWNAGEGKSEGAGVNRIGIRNEGTKVHRQIDIQLRN